MKNQLCIYDVPEPERDRWLPGDRLVRPVIRRLIRGKPRPSGLDKVLINLRLGLDRIKVPYVVNLPFRKIRPADQVAVLGRGRHCLAGYDAPNPIVAGIGLMTHPSEWPTLCADYPVVRYLQHSSWCDAVYRPYFGDRCRIWPVGIDTSAWMPNSGPKTTDFLIYDKILWDRDRLDEDLLAPIKRLLEQRHVSFETLRYGKYTPMEYKKALARCKAVIFLSPHESQGIACLEAMASGLSVFAWDQGFVMDPERFKWGQPVIAATSVPYFDERCGMRFNGLPSFEGSLDAFLDCMASGSFRPRDFVLENLTLEICASRFAAIMNEAYSNA